jgi:hypothetical protein
LKCDDGIQKHFFYHKGDSVGTWLQESVETEVCMEIIPASAQESEISESVQNDAPADPAEPVAEETSSDNNE